MNDLFHVFEFIRLYTYNLLIRTKRDWKDHGHNFELILNKLKKKGPKCNIENYFFGQTEMKYLGFWVMCDGEKPINKKIEAIENMKPITSQKQVQQFIGAVN